MERSTVMFKFLICLLLVSASLAAPTPASDIAIDSSNTLGKSVPGIIANVKATELLQPNKASEGLVKSTPEIVLGSSSAEKTQLHSSAYPFILEEPHLNNAMISSISILRELNPDSDFKVNLNEPKSKTSSTIHIINHIHSGSGNVTKKVPKAYVDKFLNNSFDSILSKAILPIKETKWQNTDRKSKRINPTRTLSGAKITDECLNKTLSATDKSDKITDKKGPEDKTQNNLYSESPVKSEANVKDSHKNVAGQTPSSINDSSVSEELNNSRRKAKVLDNGQIGTESESASVHLQLQPGHDAHAASQGRVESLSSHVERNSANQPLESNKSPLEKKSAVNKEDDKIQPIVSTNNVVNKEKQLKKEDRNKVDLSKPEGSAIINTSDKKTLHKDTDVSSALDKLSDPPTTVKNIEVGITPEPIKKIASLQSELDRGLVALNVFKKLSELLDLNEISKNNRFVADEKSVSKDKHVSSLQSALSLKNESGTPNKIISQDIEIASGASIPKVESQLKINDIVNVAGNKEYENISPKVLLKTGSKVDDKKLDNALSSSRGSLKFEENNLSSSDVSKIDASKNIELNKTALPTGQIKVTTPTTKVQTKVTIPSNIAQSVETKVNPPPTIVQSVETKVTTPSTTVKSVETKISTPSAETLTDKSVLIRKLESSITSVPSSISAKTYQESNNFRQASNASQKKHDEKQSISSQAKPVADNVSNTHLDEPTINPVTPRQGRGQVTHTPEVQWIKITPPADQTPAAKINNDEKLEVQEANYLSRAAKNQFQSNSNYPFNGDTRVSQNNDGAEKPLEESKFVKIIPTANQGVISAIPKLSQTFESSSEPSRFSSPKYIVRDNTPKAINDKESFSTPGPFGYSTANNIDNGYYSRNPTPSPVENNRQSTIVLNQSKDSIVDSLINTNVNRGRYENQQNRNTPTVGKIYSSSDNGNIAQSRDAYKNIPEISLDSPKERQVPKEIVNVLVETVSDDSKNAIRRVNQNVARNNNNFENVSPSNEPYTRGENKYKTNRFDTISAFTTDSQINKLYTQSNPTTKSQYNPLTQRPRGQESSSTVSSLRKEEKNIHDKRNEEKLVAALKVSDAKETPKGKYAVRTSRGNIKYVKNPHSADWLGDGDDKYPPQFSYNYKTATGISAYQKGVLTEINDRKVFVIHGSYNYTAPDGTPIIMTYTADEFGFHPQQTVSRSAQNKPVEPTESKDFNKELSKRRAKMVRKAQHSERMNSTESDDNSSEGEKPSNAEVPIEPAEIVEETAKLAQTANKFARGRGRNIYQEANNYGDANNVREVRTVVGEAENKTPQRIARRRNPIPTVPLESA